MTIAAAGLFTLAPGLFNTSQQIGGALGLAASRSRSSAPPS